jgi:hypothetical protein
MKLLKHIFPAPGSPSALTIRNAPPFAKAPPPTASPGAPCRRLGYVVGVGLSLREGRAKTNDKGMGFFHLGACVCSW